ncbi:hypothetical protein Ciccas_009279 [Cichlidogyrus casuarinus]|uniref:VLIG-type G domain-containing protein n=1 Tax=Cichlidogyrus casuarinus TaxID=1844966 RepID=A0ABD2PYG1_9PLAT
MASSYSTNLSNEHESENRALLDLEEEVQKMNKFKPKAISPLDCPSECSQELEISKAEIFIHRLSSLDHQFRSSLASCYDCKLHPIDVLNTIYGNSNEQTKSFITEKLFELRIAIPFGLIRLLNELEIYRRITPIITEATNEIAISYLELPIIVFCRMGDLAKSKSQIINYFLMQNKRQVFYTKEMKNGNAMKLTQNGTIDIAWYYQIDKVRPQSVVMNLHGDLLNHKNKLIGYLKSIGIPMVVILTDNATDHIKAIDDMAKDLSEIAKFIVFPLKPVGGSIKFKCKRINLVKLDKTIEPNLSRIADELHKNIDKSLNKVEPIRKIPDLGKWMRANKSSLLKIVEEDTIDQQWKEYGKLFKTWCRASAKFNQREEEIRIEAENSMGKQADMIVKSNEKNVEIIKSVCKQLLKLIDFDPCWGIENTFWAMYPWQNKFTMNNALRRIAQCYELNGETNDMNNATDLAVGLLINGYSIELCDGKNGWIYRNWLKEIFQKLYEKFPKAKVVILSVLGVQSSYKSTLLNSMFHLKFKTGISRCTEGIHMSLVEVDQRAQKNLNYTHILVLDVEGLKSTEKKAEMGTSSTNSHDNELATTIICMSDLCLININGEDTAEMTDLLQICMFAIARMKLTKVNCKFAFVHQNVSGNDAQIKEQTKKLRDIVKKQFEDAKETVSREENLRVPELVVDFTNQVYYIFNYKIDGYVAEEYAKKISIVKDAALKMMKGGGLSFENIHSLRIRSVWDAILEEKFVFYYNNAMELLVNAAVDKEYQTVIQEFKKHCQKVTQEFHRKMADSAVVDKSNLNFLRSLIEKNKQALVQEFVKPPHEDVKTRYLSQLDTDMNVDDVQSRLEKSYNDWLYKRLLYNKKFELENRFLDFCQQNAQKYEKMSIEEREEEFQQRVNRWKDTFYSEVKQELEQYSVSGLKEYRLEQDLAKKLEEKFNLKDTEEAIEKYRNFPHGEFLVDRHSLLNVSHRKTTAEKQSIIIMNKATSQFNVYIQTSHFKFLGVCKTTTNQIVDRLIETIKTSVKGDKTIRDFVCFIIFKVFLNKLKTIQEKYEQDYNPHHVVEEMAKKMREIFVTVCAVEPPKTLSATLTDLFKLGVKQELMKIKIKLIRTRLASVTRCKADLINLIQLDIVKRTEKEDLYQKVMRFKQLPEECFVEYIRMRTMHESASCKDKLQEEAEKLRKMVRDLVEQNSTKSGTFGDWLESLKKYLLSEEEKERRSFCKTLLSVLQMNAPQLTAFEMEDIRKMPEFFANLANFDVTTEFSHEEEKLMKLVYELAAEVTGCTKKCPFCGAICDKMMENHFGKHYSTNHSNSCLHFQRADPNDQNMLSMESCSNLAKELPECLDNWDFNAGYKIKPFWLWFIQENSELIGARASQMSPYTKSAAIDSLRSDRLFFSFE